MAPTRSQPKPSRSTTPRAEVLDEDVRLRNECFQQRTAIVRLEVAGDAALVRVEQQEVVRIEAGGVGRCLPALIAPHRILDLHHVRAEPGESLGAGRSRLELGEGPAPEPRTAPGNHFVPCDLRSPRSSSSLWQRRCLPASGTGRGCSRHACEFLDERHRIAIFVRRGVGPTGGMQPAKIAGRRDLGGTPPVSTRMRPAPVVEEQHRVAARRERRLHPGPGRKLSPPPRVLWTRQPIERSSLNTIPAKPISRSSTSRSQRREKVTSSSSTAGSRR